ncbi:inorganic phosphate transporter [Microbacterium karelineae]|uniref:inorganic phosphate transporter n=1 Tax=Microbacterium karelineae TaxID=2654283 RepID=UPI0012E9E0B0|nr:inorganic phosphate transporter [Microbacterium karelineae]
MAIQTTVPLREDAPERDASDKWWHLTFGLLMAISLVSFTLWSFDWVSDGTNRILLITAIVFGLFMAFNIGGNDVANSFGTSVGAGTLTMKQALIVAAVFEVSGAVLAGGEVTDTVRSGIVELDVVAQSPMDFIFIMMSALLGAAIWLLVATRMGWPVSTTHSIIGGIVGAAVTMGIATGTGGFEMVQWGGIGQIAISWILSPALGGLLAFALFWAIKRYILVYNEQADAAIRELKTERAEHRTRHKERFERLGEIQQISYNNAMAQDAAVFRQPDYDPTELETEYYQQLHEIDQKATSLDSHRALETWVPLLAAGGAIIISSMMLFKGLKNLHLGIDAVGSYLIMGMVGAAVWMAVYIFTKTLRKQALTKSTYLLFAWMQVFTASAFAFSHGANDIANAVGPFAAVLDTLRSGAVEAEAAVPPAVMVAFGVALLAGLWFIGRKVITTVGKNLTEIHPASGFAAELAAASVVMLASVLGLPVSSTHILIGAVLGVGLVNKAANWKLMRPIGLAWIITLPAAGLIGAGGYLALSAIF